MSEQELLSRAQQQALADYRERLLDERRGTSAATSFDLERPRSPVTGRIKRALAAVDRIHRIAGLPVIPVHLRDARRDVAGYTYYEQVPLAIEISTRDSSPTHSFLRELGREVDHLVLGDGELWASETSPLLADWWKVLATTPSFQLWQEIAGNLEQGDRHWRYLESAREAFARSYAQWVMWRSGDPHLRSELRAEQERERYAQVLPQTWRIEEFEPVAAELDRVFA